ncbi:MAG: right-handed parallel beta-helix repeat-containing protein [Candidatus Latescibacterota bacterium]
MRTFDINPMHFRQKDWSSPFGCKFVVENVLEELDQPGEWCLDSEDGVLYFWPLKDPIADMEVVAPVLKCLIHLRGVANVRISGFLFTETQSGEPSSHYPDVEGVGAQSAQMDWEYCGETIYLNRCTEYFIEDNKVSVVGGNGIYLRNHNERNVIRGNEISFAGSNGIVLAGGRHSIYQIIGLSAQGAPHPVFNEVTDNVIHHCGLYDTYTAGIFLGLSNWNRVAHNEIRDLPHHGINLGNSRYGRNFIAYNKIIRTCRFTSDNGAINCWNEVPVEDQSPGHVIRYNSIADTGNQFSQITMGIYLDNWTSQCLVYGNIINNIITLAQGSGIGIFVKGANNILENNILTNPGASFIWIIGMKAKTQRDYPELATVVLRNIMHDPSGKIGLFCFRASPRTKVESFFLLADHEHPWNALAQSDYNLFFGAGGDNPVVRGGIPSHWRRMCRRHEDVYDAHSLVADPLFVDAEKGDYRLKPESPAFRLEFQPIDVTRIGVRIKKTE